MARLCRIAHKPSRSLCCWFYSDSTLLAVGPWVAEARRVHVSDIAGSLYAKAAFHLVIQAASRILSSYFNASLMHAFVLPSTRTAQGVELCWLCSVSSIQSLNVLVFFLPAYLWGPSVG